ncbi:hypothetical protein O6P43_029710 [Quillaja saponaria]|uniref:Uncharacterized protein n=1 Tax=Quillaja saponaria TaxID=32244 RepID=A0AAD7L0W3_QUISA|nr:hypothetical protein O6P43_029710 [Quillaja saponaria]
MKKRKPNNRKKRVGYFKLETCKVQDSKEHSSPPPSHSIQRNRKKMGRKLIEENPSVVTSYSFLLPLPRRPHPLSKTLSLSGFISLLA